MINLQDLELTTLQWSANRGILENGKISSQVLKLVSEIGEMADNVIKGADVKDDIGDCLVLLTNIAKMSGTSLTECWNIAYDDIKDRKGFLNSNGTFIKDTEANYKKLVKASEPYQPTNIDVIDSLSIREIGPDRFELVITLVEDLPKVVIKLSLIPFTDFIFLGNLTKSFKGKTIQQLKDFLVTKGDLND